MKKSRLPDLVFAPTPAFTRFSEDLLLRYAMITARSLQTAYVDPFARTWLGFSTTDADDFIIVSLRHKICKWYLSDSQKSGRHAGHSCSSPGGALGQRAGGTPPFTRARQSPAPALRSPFAMYSRLSQNHCPSLEQAYELRSLRLFSRAVYSALP